MPKTKLLIGVLIVASIGIASLAYFFHGELPALDGAKGPTLSTQPPRTSSESVSAQLQPKLDATSARPVLVSQEGASLRMHKLWDEYGSTKSASDFHRRYKGAPIDSTERFLAEYKRLSCGSLTGFGVDKYVAFVDRVRSKAAPNPLEDTLHRERVAAYVEACRDYFSELTAERLAADLSTLHAGKSIEARSVALQQNAIMSKNASALLVEASDLILSENPLALQSMGQVWRTALHQNSSNFQNSLFQGASPAVAEAAWILASCSFGMDCSTNNELIATECRMTRRCNADSVGSFYQRYILSPEDMNLAQTLQQQIITTIRNRDLRQLGIRSGK